MAPGPSLTTQDGQGPHDAQTTSISAAPLSGDAPLPPTPVGNISETSRRLTRRSEQTSDIQTLPGTRWDELEIERQRDRQRGREGASDSTTTPSFERLSLREKSVQVPGHRVPATQNPGSVAKRRRSQAPARLSTSRSGGLSEEVSRQPVATGLLPTRKYRPKQPSPDKQQVSNRRQNPSTANTVANIHFPILPTDTEIGRVFPSSMARRPGRNQVDYVSELKEAIHESLSKLSDIQDKLAPLGQQILVLEEELKAKESDSSKLALTLRDIPKFVLMCFVLQLLTKGQ
jgi:hypothetical protein